MNNESFIYIYTWVTNPAYKRINISGHAAVVSLEHCRTVKIEWHTSIFLRDSCGGIKKTNKQRRIILYHDNVSSHYPRQLNI